MTTTSNLAVMLQTKARNKPEAKALLKPLSRAVKLTDEASTLVVDARKLECGYGAKRLYGRYRYDTRHMTTRVSFGLWLELKDELQGTYGYGTDQNADIVRYQMELIAQPEFRLPYERTSIDWYFTGLGAALNLDYLKNGKEINVSRTSFQNRGKFITTASFELRD